MSSPLVWILFPCFNQEAFLADAFSSLLAQEYDNIGIHISDDGSIDRSSQIIAEFLPRFKENGIDCIYSKNQSNYGMHENFKYLMSVIPPKSELIQIWEGDDYLLPDSIEKRVRFLLDNGFDVVHSDTNYIYEDGSMCYHDFWSNHSGYAIESPMSLPFLLQNNRIMTISMLSKVDFFKQAFDFNLFKLNEIDLCDYAACLRLIKNGAKVGYLPEATANYRLVSSSVTHSMSRDKLLEATWKVQEMGRNGTLYV